MEQTKHNEIREQVRRRYQQIAVNAVDGKINISSPSSCIHTQGCCRTPPDFEQISAKLGYSAEEMTSVPEGANLGLGCGNPQAIAALKPGETVLDLGSGGGFDCFLAARQVGESGSVIGVDMTPEMITKARLNQSKMNLRNTEFRLGEIEHLPVADATVDVILSNCVINLSPDKQQVLHEAFRVLKPGGRLAISDVVTTAKLPKEIKEDMQELYSGCISGASSRQELQTMLRQSGFVDISIELKDESKVFIGDWLPEANLEQYLSSAVIQAIKPLKPGGAV